MEHPDLFVFPRGHPPSPYDVPVAALRGERWAVLHLPEGLRLAAVGWLERPGFARGPVADECIEALVAAHRDKIVSDGTRGVHTCTLCQATLPALQWRDRAIQLKGHGHYLVQMAETVYMAPELLLHYICEHGYCPPQEFVRATLDGRFLGADDLEIRWEE